MRTSVPVIVFAALAGWAAGSLVLDAPVFLAAFNAWVAAPPPWPCAAVPANLAAMFRQGEGGFWNYVQIGGAAVPAATRSWGGLKSAYE